MDDKAEAFKAGCSHECPFCDNDSVGCILTDLPYKWDEYDLKGEE